MIFLKKIAFATLVALAFITVACNNDAPKNTEPEIALQPVAVPKFERDTAFAFVAKQVSFGPRVPNSEAQKRCKDWLVEQFTAYGLKVTEQPFTATAYTGKQLNGVNIIAQYKPEAAKRIFLAAHWDSRHIADSPLATERQKEPILGADDGASGVGIILEIARTLQNNPADLGVDFVLFDAEDYGDDNDDTPNPNSWCLGSQHWSRNLVPSSYRPKYGILLDMVGAKGAKFTKEGVSMNYAPTVMNKVWKTGQNLGYPNYFVDEKSGPVTDDHYFVNTIANIPMIDIIGKSGSTQTGFGAHWHTHNDDMGIIDVRALRAVGQTLLEVIYQEAAGRF
ncbi:MAG: M28 family peptidase [Saprospiraceae bacterium]|nr:M28 family peptidase [Saprospiraceae bacterium]MCF8313758.1 M28 family peptidase [Saprospiraceae bacterium]MCF8442464.1 M28 family peptidase [Saprospiraceae bacterium]